MVSGVLSPDGHFRVVIFGSARIKPESPHYQLIRSLAEQIAQEGMDVVTGGGPGLMDAASRGHFEGRKGNDVHTIGLQIHLPHEQMDSSHLDIKKEFLHFTNRLDTFLQLSDCIVVAPGGVGTLLELFFAWQLMQVGHRPKMPIILLGEMWPDLLEWLRRWALREHLLDPIDMDVLHIAKTVPEAMSIINKTRNQSQSHTVK